MNTNRTLAVLAMLLGLLVGQEAAAFYNPSTGRWLSRDPVQERGGANLYASVENRPVSANDFLGLVICTTCRGIDDYLNSIGVEYAKTKTPEGFTYSFAGKDAGKGDASAKLIITRMLMTRHAFKPKASGGPEEDNLRKHVKARLTIVENALKADFLFGGGRYLFPPEFWADPQAYFDKINGTGVSIACKQLTQLIFETGNRFGRESEGGWTDGRRSRNNDLPVWIPGDWGYIINTAFVEGQDDPVYAGENVIHTGTDARGELFWGHFEAHKHPSESEQEWFKRVGTWGGAKGGAKWRDYIKYPTTGLRQ